MKVFLLTYGSGTGTVAQSPFVIAMNRAGVKGMDFLLMNKKSSMIVHT